MTPEKRASEVLFGDARYVPNFPNARYEVSWARLVATIREAENAALERAASVLASVVISPSDLGGIEVDHDATAAIQAINETYAAAAEAVRALKHPEVPE